MSPTQRARAEHLLWQFETQQPDSQPARIAKTHLREMLAHPELYSDGEASDVIGLCEARHRNHQQRKRKPTMRNITNHIVNPENDKLTITVEDEPGQGGACHFYTIRGFNTETNDSAPFLERYGKSSDHTTILFQNGPIEEYGVNGITQEAIIAICIDRLRSFQAGPFSCRENAIAMTHLENALMWLQKRTLERMRRGVEGKSIV